MIEAGRIGTPTRRRLLRDGACLALGTFGLGGCGNSGEEQTLMKTVLPAFGLGDNRQYTVADVERVPFASIGVRFGSNPEAMVALGVIEPDHRLVWVSAEHRLFVTRGARVVRFTGLDYDIVIDADPAIDPLVTGLGGRHGHIAMQWTLSYPKRNIFGLQAISDFSPAGPDSVQWLYKKIPATRWVERVTIAQANWSFKNEYWVGDDGKVWKSRQYLAPYLPALNIQVLRPANVT